MLREVSEIGGAPGIAFQSYFFDGFNWRSGAWRLLPHLEITQKESFGKRYKGILMDLALSWTSRSKAARNFAFLRAALFREVSEIGGAPGIAFQSYDFDGFNWRSGAWRLLSPFGDHTKGILWKALQRDSIGPRLWTSRSKAARNFAFLRAALLREVSLVPPLSHLHLMHRAQDSRVPLRSHPFILCTGHRIHDSLHSSSSLCTGHRIVQILPDHARLSYAQGKGFTSSAWSLPRSYAQGTGFTSSAPVFHPMHSAQDTLAPV